MLGPQPHAHTAHIQPLPMTALGSYPGLTCGHPGMTVRRRLEEFLFFGSVAAAWLKASGLLGTCLISELSE